LSLTVKISRLYKKPTALDRKSLKFRESRMSDMTFSSVSRGELFVRGCGGVGG